MQHTTPITTLRAPRPRGHYAQGRAASDLLFVSAQLPLPPAGAGCFEGPAPTPASSIEVQTERALRNVLAILEAGGCTASGLIRLTAYVTDMEDWAALDRTCARVLGEHTPARAVVAVPGVHGGWRVAIEGVGLRGAAATGVGGAW